VLKSRIQRRGSGVKCNRSMAKAPKLIYCPLSETAEGAARRGTRTKTATCPSYPSGTGITLTAAVTRAHASGAQIAGSVPTPGAPNQYYRKELSAKK
jgi:hypothetical protein